MGHGELPMTNDPLRTIEDEKAQKDIGVMGYRVYLGARETGASVIEAWLVLYAYFAGMFRSTKNDDDNHADSTT